MGSDQSSSSGLEIHIQVRGEASVIAICGSVHVDDCGRLRQVLESGIAQKPKVIVLDMSQMGFISSTGLGVIVWAHIRCRHHKGVIRLVRPVPDVQHLLEMTSLDHLFTSYESVEAALAA